MSLASEGHGMFAQVEDLGTGIKALGEILRVSTQAIVPETISGLGILLRHLGEAVRDLSSQSIDVFDEIKELEDKESHLSPALKTRMAQLKRLLRESDAPLPGEQDPLPPSVTRIFPE